MSSPTKESVSICLPVYNGSAYIGEAIESALLQTHADFELLVVDNCSTDDTVAIVQRHMQSDGRIVLHCNASNLGLVGNWNRCLELASGQWIKFLFHDDLLAPDCLEQLLAAVEPGERIVACRRSIIGGNSAPTAATGFYLSHAQLLADIFRRNTHATAEDVCRLILDHPGTNIIGEPTSVMFRRDLARDFGPFNPDLIMECDSEWWYRVAVNVGMRFVDQELVSFRLHGESASSTAHSNRQFRYRHLDRLVVLRQMVFHPAFQPLRAMAARRAEGHSMRLELARHLRSAKRHIARLRRTDPALADQCNAELRAMMAVYPDMDLPWYVYPQEKILAMLRRRHPAN